MIIPGQVTSIEGSAFACNSLSSISIPANVSLIGERAFEGNELTSVVIPDGVTTIGEFAFYDNPLEIVSISEDATFDLSPFPEGVEIIIRKDNVEPTPDLVGSNDQIDSIDDITTPDQISTFELKEPVLIASQDIDILTVGTNKKDKITGASEGEVLVGGVGKDVLKVGGGADGFFVNQSNQYGKKKADKIKDFDSDKGDSILVDQDIFGLGKKIKLKSYGRKNKVKKAAQSKNDFVYDKKRGLLYFNENGKQKGWGDGGLFAKLQGAPELGADDFTIV